MSLISLESQYFQARNIAAIFVALGLYYFFTKYFIPRHTLNKKLPGFKLGIFDVLGQFHYGLPADIPKHLEKYPMTYGLQYGSGFTELYRNETFFIGWAGYVPGLCITRAQGAEDLLGGGRHLEKSWVYDYLTDWLSLGLLTSPVKKWRSRRKLIAPCFHLDILKEFLPIMNEKSKYLVDHVLKKETSNEWSDLSRPISLCSLDIILETSMGVNMKAQENSKSEYFEALNGFMLNMAKRLLHPHYAIGVIFYLSEYGRNYRRCVKILREFTLKVIQEKKAQLKISETPSKKKLALMDMLLEHQLQHGDLSEEDIREEVDTFTFTGHDTTAVGLGWTFYLIGLHKDIQNRLHEDIDRIFGDDTERQITVDDLAEMEYLDRVVKESLRLYPSVPLWGRISTNNTVIGGHKIPPGISCGIFTYGLHRDPEQFPNPEKFDPDRFLPEISAKRHPYSYMPFSIGPRNCVGQRYAMMQVKVVVTNVLRNFTLESLDPRDKVIPSPDSAIRHGAPIRIKIRERIR